MLNNFIRLFFGSTIGVFSTVVNIKATNANIIQALHLGEITAICGIVSACFTCVYLYWQIRKIKYDLKQKKQDD